MNLTSQILIFLGGSALLTKQTFKEAFKKPFYINLIIEQVYSVGVKSLPLVVIVALSTGMVMALQFGVSLEKFGGKLYVPKIVSLSIVREMGPVFCCLMLAARVSSGMASEIGSMKVTQQLDAIRALGTSPLKKIVIPRILACLIVIPLLCVMANTAGILGSLTVGVFDLNLNYEFYVQKIFATVSMSDYISGIIKSAFFALFIALSACFYGLRVSGGTKGVGQATTRAVVTASILIVVGDYFLTKLLIIVESWLT